MDRELNHLKLESARTSGRIRTALDVILVLLIVAAVISIAATAPSTTYAYAQLQQIGAVVGSIESSNWLLPRDQLGGFAIKPQLYVWLDAPVLMITGIYNDFTFRLPTVLASLVSGVLVYFLGRRWYDRRVGLLAACLWATAQHMGKMTYVAITDMLLSLWILVAIMCADRLLFHRAPRRQRWKWAVGLWAVMILGAVTKGWGIANLIFVGGALALATAVGPGFALLRAVDGFAKKMLLTIRLVLRRWRKAMKATYLAWGILAMVVVLTPIWAAMFVQGGSEFAGVFDRDVFQRITGSGENPPHSRSTGPALNLLYYTLPMSIFMVGALVLAGPRRWFVHKSPIFLPLCWILAVVVPFSLTHAFRPDYLLPCYAAVALMAAWAVEETYRLGRNAGVLTQILRHVIAAAPVVIGVALILLPLIYLYYDHMPRFIAKNIRMPSAVPAPTWWVLTGLAGLGVVVLVLAVRWSLQWRVRRVAAVAVVGMLGV
ncbi:MAG: glycosyltransferase family 39 protein, partial [Planctomycetota bacterium]|nr:glycosyltransferase family 39 protein [Planctomycetota bacterium]